MTGLADDDLAERTNELVRQAVDVSAAAREQADELERTIEELRRELWGGK